MNLQDAFINQIRTQKIKISVHLLTGETVRGFVRGFDPTVIVLDVDEDQQYIIYKHSISMIIPDQVLDLFNSNQERE